MQELVEAGVALHTNSGVKEAATQQSAACRVTCVCAHHNRRIKPVLWGQRLTPFLQGTAGECNPGSTPNLNGVPQYLGGGGLRLCMLRQGPFPCPGHPCELDKGKGPAITCTTATYTTQPLPYTMQNRGGDFS